MRFNTLIGPAARAENFFPRPIITEEIWEKLESGSNVLLAAPRRVGKSSFLFDLLDHPRPNTIIIYFTSESVNNENEFFRKLFCHLIEKLNFIKKYSTLLGSKAKEIFKSVESIGKDGITFRPDSTISYYQELTRLLNNLPPDGYQIIVLVDEFAQTVENIIQDEDERAAIHFLESKREIRQLPKVHKKLQFVYAGSIGLENIVGKINGMNFVNDLTPVPIPPLTKDEASNLCKIIMNGTVAQFDKDSFEYLLTSIGWWIPYHFHLLLDETAKILTAQKVNIITTSLIDQAIDNALKERLYFEHWFTRLRKAYKGDEFSFVKEILNTASATDALPSNEIYNLAIKYKLDTTFTDLINALKYDGYINNSYQPTQYQFNSPLLKKWWYSNVAN